MFAATAMAAILHAVHGIVGLGLGDGTVCICVNLFKHIGPALCGREFGIRQHLVAVGIQLFDHPGGPFGCAFGHRLYLHRRQFFGRQLAIGVGIGGFDTGCMEGVSFGFGHCAVFVSIHRRKIQPFLPAHAVLIAPFGKGGCR